MNEKPELMYPSNSKLKRVNVEKKQVEKVVEGKIITRKKSQGKKLFQSFVGEDGGDITSYIFEDIVLPSLRNAASDIIKYGLDIVKDGFNVLIFGDKRGGKPTSVSRNEPRVSYNNYSKSSNERRPTREISRVSKAQHVFDEIEFDSRGEAQNVLYHLVDLIERYEQATVSDFYDLVGITKSFADERYGWKELGRARVIPSRGGYIIELPRTILLD
jgi:hypothetical protein